MITVELLLVFVLIILDIIFCVLGGYLLPFVGACFSFVFAGLLLDNPSNVIYTPYPQLFLIMVAVVCAMKGVLTARGVVD